MSEKKSLLVDKSKMPLAMGLAFVAFTTQFGGGFASGAQIYQYFINYGIWCLILPLVTQGLYALFFWYGMRYAYKHKTYDYRSFSDSLYGKTRHVMSNLYEICYLIMIGTASAAAFATGGSTLQTLFGIPYWVCTLIIAAFIFFIALYGTNVVRKCASTLSVLIIIGLVLVLVPNIIAQWGDITASIGRMTSGEMPVISSETGAFGPALWSAILYFFFQLASVSVMYQHMGRCYRCKTDQQSSHLDVHLQLPGHGTFHLRSACDCLRSRSGHRIRSDAGSGAKWRRFRYPDPNHLDLDHPRRYLHSRKHDLRYCNPLR